MPVIKVQHVVSCSSEDKIHKCDSLFNGDSFKKWKCAEPGEKHASVILQLEKANKIHSIDVGNEHSAFVEVLVGKSTAEDPNEFQVILVTSSFMNPVESKNSNNPNRVRMFGPDKLSKAVIDQKWDRIKIVCTQPFNKHVQYGLSFITFHSPQEEGDFPASSLAPKLGSFKLKDEKPSLIKVGSFFQNRGNEKEEPAPLTGAAAVRAASNSASAKVTQISNILTMTVLPPKPKKRKSDLTEDHPPTVSTSKASQSGQSSKMSGLWSTVQLPAKRRLSDEKTEKKEKASKRRSEESELHSKTSQQPPLKKAKSEERKHSKEDASPKSFNDLMSDVTFVLSGFKNPFRGELRDKACKMGAVYKADWGPGCTHLICAFMNTPKYTQAKGKGKIVKKGWVIDSYRKKMLLPWQRYKLTKEDESSTDDESEEETPPPKKHKKPKQKPETPASPERKTSTQAKPVPSERERTPPKPQSEMENNGKQEKATKPSEPDPFDDSTDKESIGGDDDKPKVKGLAARQTSSEGDTEDELRRVREKNSKKEADQYAESTDDDEDEPQKQKKPEQKKQEQEKPEQKKQEQKKPEQKKPDQKKPEQKKPEQEPDLPDLPNFFEGKHFLLFGKFAEEERRQLKRFIIAFGGTEENYMGENVNFVVSNSEWDGNFDQALEENCNIAFVRPKWLFTCNKNGKMVPYQQYIIAPAS